MDPDSPGQTCVFRKIWTSQRITACRASVSHRGHHCKDSYDNNYVGWNGWKCNVGDWVEFKILPAIVSIIELSFYGTDGKHLLKEFSLSLETLNGWILPDVTINIDDADIVAPGRINIGTNPWPDAEYRIAFNPVPNVVKVVLRTFDSFSSNKNAHLTEIVILGSASGQFSSTTRDHQGRQLVLAGDSLLQALEAPAVLPAHFEIEPQIGRSVCFVY